MNNNASPLLSTTTSPRRRALVQMYEIVTASNWTGSINSQSNNTNMNMNMNMNMNTNIMIVSDLRPLLLLMDIGSCASAEKHCKVNCVTASMGDVVIENYPIVGDLLELRASPVSVGNTSLDISVLIIAHSTDSSSTDTDSSTCDGEVNDDCDSDNDDSSSSSNSPSSSSSSSLQTRRVCEAFFTYVTTRGPNGEKRYVPPLELEEQGDTEQGDTEAAGEEEAGEEAGEGRDKQDNSHHIRKLLKWERTLAYFRKELIRSEQQLAKLYYNNCSLSCRDGDGDGNKYNYNNNNNYNNNYDNNNYNTNNYILEMSEVVLPSNQNHMKHLFGGVVMGWMCKSVIAGCVKICRLPINKFHIRAIHRVDFPTGADVSDHVFFRPRITAIFEQGRSAEFEVKVGKRSITPINISNGEHQQQQDIYDDHDESLMNIGHFYVSGSLSYIEYEDNDVGNDDGKKIDDATTTTSSTTTKKKKKKNLSSSIAPFAKLLNTHKHLYSNDSIHNRIERNMAYQRRKSLLARRHLLAGLGESIQWDSTSALKIQAPLLTILSVLRLCDEYETNSNSNSSSSDDDNNNDCDASYYQNQGPVWKVANSKGSDEHAHVIEWTPGSVDTVLLRGKTVISRRKLCQNEADDDESESSSSSSLFLEAVYTTLRDKRPQWDPACKSVTILEENNDDDDEVDDEAMKPEWDIVEYKMQTPNAQTKFCLLRVGAYVNDDNDVGKNSISNSKNRNKNDITSGVLASRSVIHDKSDAKNRVLPSGWLLKMINSNNNRNDDNDDDDNEFIEITYIAEQDFAKLRDNGVGGNKDVTDEYLAKFYGSYISQWFTNLASFDHTTVIQ